MRLKDFLDISEAPDLQTFESRLVQFAQNLDFGIVSGALVVEHSVGRATSFHLGNTPKAFASTFVDTDIGRRDPVLRRLKRLSAPFVYDQSMYVREQAADLWETQAAFGYHTGVAMALHLPGGKHFVMGVDRDKPLPSDDGAVTRLMADLQLLAVHAQETAIRLFLPKAYGMERLPELTIQEIEILKWTSVGKSRWDVSEILGVTERAVRYHMQKILVKLGAVSPVDAVLRAKTLGLI